MKTVVLILVMICSGEIFAGGFLHKICRETSRATRNVGRAPLRVVHGAGRAVQNLPRDARAAVIGAATFGAGALVAPLAEAAAAGVVTAAGIATGHPVNVEAKTDGRNVSVGSNFTTRNGTYIGYETGTHRDEHFDPDWQNKIIEERRARNAETEISKIVVNNVNGNEYSLIQTNKSEILIPKNGREWRVNNRGELSVADSQVGRGVSGRSNGGISIFSPKTSAERQAMSSFSIGKTPLGWHFDRRNINGTMYNHAYTDTLLDIFVPADQKVKISAPGWYDERNHSYRGILPTTFNKIVNLLGMPSRMWYPDATYDTRTREAKGLYNEFLNGIARSIYESEKNKEAMTREIVSTSLSYYDKGMELAKKAGQAAVDMMNELSVPGGVQNARDYAERKISEEEYLNNIAQDVVTDTMAMEAGAMIGGTGGGLVGAMVSGGSAAIPASNAGSIAGGAAGYTISRIAKATSRIIARGENSSYNINTSGRTNGSVKGSSDGDRKGTGEAAKQRIVDTAEGRNECWNQMKKSGEWESVSGYDKSTLRNKDTGDLAQKSIEKWEIEVYNKREAHIGVIKPSDGRFHPELKVPGRMMRK